MDNAFGNSQQLFPLPRIDYFELKDEGSSKCIKQRNTGRRGLVNIIFSITCTQISAHVPLYGYFEDQL